MHTEGSVEISRPVDLVFRLTQEDVAHWSSMVVEDEMIEAKPQVVGSWFRTVTQVHGRRLVFTGVITEHRVPTLHRVQLTGQWFDIDVCYTFTPLGMRTRVTQSSSVQGKGFLRWLLKLSTPFAPFFTKANRRALQKELDLLKQYCEGYSDSARA